MVTMNGKSDTFYSENYCLVSLRLESLRFFVPREAYQYQQYTISIEVYGEPFQFGRHTLHLAVQSIDNHKRQYTAKSTAFVVRLNRYDTYDFFLRYTP
jgi:hypothetical protein